MRRAPARKQRAPSEVPQLAAARSRIDPLDVTKYAATAEMPKSTQPAKFTAAAFHSLSLRAGSRRPPDATRYARAPEIRKSAEPTRSGVQISRFSWWVESPSCLASKVLTLKSSVPRNWAKALHQEGSLPQRCPRLTVPSRSSRPAATVKKTEPVKKTAPSAPAPTSSMNPGNGPTTKHADPIAKPAEIARSHALRVSGRGAKLSAWPITDPLGRGPLRGSGSSSSASRSRFGNRNVCPASNALPISGNAHVEVRDRGGEDQREEHRGCVGGGVSRRRLGGGAHHCRALITARR